jgi:hypothetical protein
MKVEQLKHLIREIITEAVTELSGMYESRNDDPSKEEMVQYLWQAYGRLHGGSQKEFEFDVEEAIYWFANDFHGGQSSNLYSVLSTSDYRPGAIARGPEKGSMAEELYHALVQKWGHEKQMQEANSGGNPQTTLKHIDNDFYQLSPKQAKEFSVDGQLPRPGYQKKADISKLKGLMADHSGRIEPLDIADSDTAWIQQTKTWGKMVWAVMIHRKHPLDRFPQSDEKPIGEDGGAGAGAGASGGVSVGNTTAAVQGYNTPNAFGKKRKKYQEESIPPQHRDDIDRIPGGNPKPSEPEDSTDGSNSGLKSSPFHQGESMPGIKKANLNAKDRQDFKYALELSISQFQSETDEAERSKIMGNIRILKGFLGL